MELKSMLMCSLFGLTLGCGPKADGAEDAGSEPDMSWALGFFHRPETGTGMGKGQLSMYELRPDGTGRYVLETCEEGLLGPFEFSWRALSEDEIEIFHSESETFQWIAGIQESVKVERGEDDVVHAYEWGSLSANNTYQRGKLCISDRPELEDCRDFGFTVQVCGD